MCVCVGCTYVVPEFGCTHVVLKFGCKMFIKSSDRSLDSSLRCNEYRTALAAEGKRGREGKGGREEKGGRGGKGGREEKGRECLHCTSARLSVRSFTLCLHCAWKGGKEGRKGTEEGMEGTACLFVCLSAL